MAVSCRNLFIPLGRRAWRSVALAMVAALTVIGAALPAPPATAASHDGRLLINGPGSVYSEHTFVSQSVASGNTSIYSLRVVNSGNDTAQFLVTGSATGPDGHPTSVGLFKGSTSLANLVAGGGYYTPPIPPGGYLQLSLKVPMPATWRSDQSVRTETFVELQATDGTPLSQGVFYTEVAAPTYGELSADLFAKQGTQLWVGGVDSSTVVMTSPAVKAGASTTFNLRLQNDGSSPGAITLTMYTDTVGCFVPKVLVGTKDVTVAAVSGDHTTPVLGVGKHQALKIVFTRDPQAECYGANTLYLVAEGSGSRTEAVLAAPIPAA